MTAHQGTYPSEVIHLYVKLSGRYDKANKVTHILINVSAIVKSKRQMPRIEEH